MKESLREYIEKSRGSESDKLSDPQEMRGSLTLNEIASEYMVGIKDLIGELDLDDKVDLNLPVKDLLKPLGREVQEVRDAVQKLKDKKP